jgi:hypothetical protein
MNQDDIMRSCEAEKLRPPDIDSRDEFTCEGCDDKFICYDDPREACEFCQIKLCRDCYKGAEEVGGGLAVGYEEWPVCSICAERLVACLKCGDLYEPDEIDGICDYCAREVAAE